MNKLCVFLLIIFLSMSCSNYRMYYGDWIIYKLTFQDRSLIDYIGVRNMRINMKRGGFIPSVDYQMFLDEDKASITESFLFLTEGGKDLVIIKGPKFFSDTFEIKCINESCCRIALQNKDKYIELVFNGELSMGIKRRDCPKVSPTDIFPEN